jgi:electron transport complex protein RnfC
VDTLLINGAECEPYLTVDYRIMVEYAEDVVKGIRILLRVLGLSRAIIGIENHSDKAISSLQKALGNNQTISVLPLKVKYPQGAEKMFIKAALGRIVPSGGLPADVGVIVHNIGTALAVYQAICLGKPLYERIVTVSGEAITRPQNFLTPIGTPIGNLIAACGGITVKKALVIIGGPMTGTAVSGLDYPVVKGTSGIVVLPDKNKVKDGDSVCINCGRCFNACPMRLRPSELSDLSGPEMIDQAKDLNVLDCCNCGACSVVCPARRQNSEIIKSLKISVGKSQTNRGGS